MNKLNIIEQAYVWRDYQIAKGVPVDKIKIGVEGAWTGNHSKNLDGFVKKNAFFAADGTRLPSFEGAVLFAADTGDEVYVDDGMSIEGLDGLFRGEVRDDEWRIVARISQPGPRNMKLLSTLDARLEIQVSEGKGHTGKIIQSSTPIVEQVYGDDDDDAEENEHG